MKNIWGANERKIFFRNFNWDVSSFIVLFFMGSFINCINITGNFGEYILKWVNWKIF